MKTETPIEGGVLEVVDTVTPAMRTLAVAIGLTALAADADRVTIEGEITRTVKENAVKAAAYDALRKVEIDAAVQEKIRAEGDSFDDAAQARTRQMLEAVDSIETIREFTAEWKTKGDARFANGRTSEDGDDPTDEEKGKARTANAAIGHIPADKFAGGV